MNKFALRKRGLGRKEEGASLIEYAVIAALVVAIAVAAFATLGGGLEESFAKITDKISSATE